jgi:flagellin-like protein
VRDGEGRSDRSQIGLGTLLVFLALIVVGAVAAGLLLQSAGVLGTRGEEAGRAAQQRVNGGVLVHGKLGEVDTDGGSVTTVQLQLGPAPGASDLNLTRATVVYDGGRTAALGYTEGSADAVSFSTVALRGDDTVLTEQSDRIVLTIDVAAIETGSGGLGRGERAELRITTPYGATTTVELFVPDPLGSRAVVELSGGPG